MRRDNCHIKKNKVLLFDQEFQKNIQHSPLLYVDIGASDALATPWRELVTQEVGSTRVIGFEPDADECNRLNRQSPENCLFLPVALWNDNATVSFKRCAALGMSSIYPPNHPFIQKYEKTHWTRRITDHAIDVEASTLDATMEKRKLSPDLIKCDTQGAEYEIMEGAKKILEEDTHAVILETWPIEVHRGQKISFEVEALMDKYGFEPIVRQIHGRWRRLSSRGLVELPQETSYDILFMRKESELTKRAMEPEKLLKLSAIADVYGAVGYALNVLEIGENKYKSHNDIFSNTKDTIRKLRKRSLFDVFDKKTNSITSQVLQRLHLQKHDFAPLG